MRLFIEIAVVMATLAAQAFDSAEWLGKRALLEREAERLAVAHAKCRAAAADPAENLSVPFESHPDGSVKASVSAEKAKMFLKEGLVWGTGVRIRQYRADGTVEAEIDAESCVVDRETKSGWAEGRARARFRDDVEVEGSGVYFSAPEAYLAIYSNVVVKSEGRRLGAVRADYDNQSGVAMFDGAVTVHGDEDGHPYDLSARQAFAFVSGTNDLKRIVALGDVAVTNESRVGSCDRAVYSRRDARIVLYGAGDSLARLAENGRSNGEVEGSKITFWLDSEQVEVVDSRVTIDAGGLKLPIAPGES